MFLLDSDILSNLISRVPSANLIARPRVIPPERQFTSAINVGELIYGAQRAGNRKDDLLRRIERALLPNLTALSLDLAAARRYGELRAYLEQRGIPIGDADTRIAAIALVRGLTVITGNTRHFNRVPGLAVENWLT